MTAEHTEATPGRLRALNLNLVAGSLSAVGALLVAIEARTWQEVVVLGLGLAAGWLAVTRWTVGRVPRVAYPCLAVAAVVWILAVVVTGSATGSYGIAIVGTVIVHGLPRHRTAVVGGLVAGAAAVVAVKPVVSAQGVLDVLVQYVLVSGVVATVGVVLTSLHQGVSGLTAELEEARRREAELAVMRERMRFAGDLHDIQGHTLHVVKMKTALAAKLLRSDAERAEEELREVHALVGDTITQTKELAYAQRRLTLSAELENAKNLFEAAGISVRVDREGDGEADGREGALLGQVLRETTTNILRHAEAAQVRITLSETGISIVNDGAQETALPELRGLSTLRERVAGGGGVLDVEQENGRFRTAATFPGRKPRPAD